MLQEVAKILQQDIKDPRIKMATVTEVSVSPDLKNAKIYVSFFTDEESKIQEALEGLQSAAGYIRTALAKNMDLRYMPQLSFVFDSLLTDSMKLDALIASGTGSAPAESKPEAEDTKVAAAADN